MLYWGTVEDWWALWGLVSTVGGWELWYTIEGWGHYGWPMALQRTEDTVGGTVECYRALAVWGTLREPRGTEKG